MDTLDIDLDIDGLSDDDGEEEEEKGEEVVVAKKRKSKVPSVCGVLAPPASDVPEASAILRAMSALNKSAMAEVTVGASLPGATVTVNVSSTKAPARSVARAPACILCVGKIMFRVHLTRVLSR